MTPNAGLSWEQAVQRLREQPEQRQLVLDCYYDDPLSEAAQRYWKSREWTAVRRLLPAGRNRALDVGAGRGIASYALAREGYSVTSLEPDASSIVGAGAIRALAAAAALDITVVQDFSERLPFADGHFDVVFARAVLHHTRDLRLACAEFRRVLRPGGRLIAIREHVIDRADDLPAFLESHPLHYLYGGENAFTLVQYREALEAAGLQVKQTLAPFDSPINWTPRSRFLSWLMAREPIWSVASAALNRVDHRPGRLYSFVAERT